VIFVRLAGLEIKVYSSMGMARVAPEKTFYHRPACSLPTVITTLR